MRRLWLHNTISIYMCVYNIYSWTRRTPAGSHLMTFLWRPKRTAGRARQYRLPAESSSPTTLYFLVGPINFSPRQSSAIRFYNTMPVSYRRVYNIYIIIYIIARPPYIVHRCQRKETAERVYGLYIIIKSSVAFPYTRL